MATKTLLTIDQYLALGEDPPGVRYELSDGELIVTPSSTRFHNEFRDEFTARLRTFLKAHPFGIVISETDVQLGESTVRRPDIAFIQRERIRGTDPDLPLTIAPDLAIEIFSRTDRTADLLRKVSEYLKAGTQAVWVFYPRLLRAYRYSNEQTQCLVPDDEFSEPELLPGFTLKISEIFSWGASWGINLEE